ncbi:calcium/sodium antiporter [Alcanivorax sp. 1008]|uniref:calcium/sodium antiporter n=1 Tax=Alcanivorax sp. 1008 TaxID=2816853 RepID=UPI001D873B4E|nr:calcium/sodium antiporter [Alcanivorax sp. 1008]MCC1497126.1 calcium/sodium antiporter [Alcanivorax sp. 1008]
MLLNIGLIIGGFVVLVFGADWLVKGASRLALSLGMTPLVVGLTVVAFGTSAPELAVSVASAWSGQADLAVGNVIGSNVANILLILGLSAVVAPLVVHQQLVRLDVPIMLGASVLFYTLALDGRISMADGAILAGGIVLYVTFLIRQSRREKSEAVLAEYEGAMESGGSIPMDIVWMVAGLVGLVAGAQMLVEGAVSLARAFGVSELMIGLTVLAIGTSLPELATSVVAAVRGERDIAVGNVVGSNIFNLLSVLGFTGLVSLGQLPVAPAALTLDIPVMLGVALLCMPIFRAGFIVTRANGAFFLLCYAAYIGWLVVDNSGTPPSWMSVSLLSGLIPMAILFTMVSFVRYVSAEKASTSDH